MVIKILISHKLEKNSLLQNLNEISNKILVTLKVIISLTDLLLEWFIQESFKSKYL